MQKVNQFSEALPYAFREQVIGYAASVDRELPNIFREIRRKFDQDKADQVVFWSAIRKCYDTVSSTFWILHHSSNLLRDISDAETIAIGSNDFTRGGKEYRQLQSLLEDLDQFFLKHDLKNFLTETPRDTLLRLFKK